MILTKNHRDEDQVLWGGFKLKGMVFAARNDGAYKVLYFFEELEKDQGQESFDLKQFFFNLN